jgi:transcriptional regulator with XRE-family HTH domain
MGGFTSMADPPLKDVVRGRIRALREERRLTQEELCERARISVDAVNRIENGSRVPTIDTLEKIAAALGSSVTDLLHRPATKPTKSPAPLRRMINLVENEPLDVQEAVEQIVRAALKLAKARPPKSRS